MVSPVGQIQSLHCHRDGSVPQASEGSSEGQVEKRVSVILPNAWQGTCRRPLVETQLQGKLHTIGCQVIPVLHPINYLIDQAMLLLGP